MRDIVALIPAHNEEGSIKESVKSVNAQVGCTLVILDNCTDGTERQITGEFCDYVHTRGNTEKKAGALNQAMTLPTVYEAEYIMVMDADSFIDPGFVDRAMKVFDSDPEVGAVGGTFRGREGGGYVGTMQRNEYARYARDVRRLKGKALNLTGTATIFRGVVIRQLIRERGKPYDTKVLTEDYEISLAIMSRGWKILAPKECTLSTEVMESWTELKNQRLRWKRGAVENLVDYGISRVTAIHWGYQLLSVVGLIVSVLYLGTLLTAVIVGNLHFIPLIVVGTIILSIERFVTIYYGRGLTQALMSSTLLYELPYDLFLQVVHAMAYMQALLQVERKW